MMLEASENSQPRTVLFLARVVAVAMETYLIPEKMYAAVKFRA